MPWSLPFSGITLLVFLELGESTVGPNSEGFESIESFFGGGRGSKAGSVGGGPDEKYLPQKQISSRKVRGDKTGV